MMATIAIPTDNSRPGLPGELEILGRRVERAFTGNFNPLEGHVALGHAAATLELVGLDWHDFSTTEQVVSKSEAIRTLAAQPLVTERGLPIKWLIGADRNILGVDGLSAIAQAIELAEELDENWRQWINTITAVDIIVHELPRLQTLVDAKTHAELGEVLAQVDAESAGTMLTSEPATKVEAKTERKGLSKGVRKAIAKAKGRGDWDEVRRLGGQIPTHVLEARTKTAKVVILPPAPEATPEPVVTATPQAPKPGEVIEKNGILHVLCTGRYGNCLALTPVDKALVAKSLGSIMHATRVRRFEELDETKLMKVSFCQNCGPRILLGGCQTVPEALAARDRRIAEAEARQKAEAREASLEAERIARAKRAKNNGAFGDPSRPRPAAYLAKKAEKAAKSRAEMAKGPSGGGGQHHSGKKKSR